VSQHLMKTQLIGGNAPDDSSESPQSEALPDGDTSRAIGAGTNDLVEAFTSHLHNQPATTLMSGGDATVFLSNSQTAPNQSPTPQAVAESLPGSSLLTPDDFGDATINLQSVTESFEEIPFGAETVALGQATGPLSAATAQTAASGTSEFDPRLMTVERATAELEQAKVAIATDPDNTDLLFRMAIMQHRTGDLDESRATLMKLANAYQSRGQEGHAARIMSMLGQPAPQPASQPQMSQFAIAETVPLSKGTGRLTAQLGRTAVLRNGTAMIGKAATEVVAAPTPPLFPPESLVFTMPLPGESHQDAELREIINLSTADLKEGRLNAALDACLYALYIEPGYVPLYLRIAEIYTVQRLTRRARAQAQTLLRLVTSSGDEDSAWMIYRVLLHASDKDLVSLRRVVELLIANGEAEQASYYASKLVQLLDAEGLTNDALDYSMRLCKMIPGDTRAALENAILRVKAGELEGAVDRWESAAASGADQSIARASLAAVMSAINENEFWTMLAQVAQLQRQAPHDQSILDAYNRTSAALMPTTSCVAGQGLLSMAAGDQAATGILTTAAGDRTASPLARATSSVALAWSLQGTDQVDQYVAAVRTSLQLLEDSAVANHPAWEGLLGRVPRFEDLSLQLGETLLSRDDPAGAAEVLKAAHEQNKFHHDICRTLADAYFKIGQLGSALTILDGLAVHFRNSGQLDPMAAVLRQMSQLAPNNIKVKSRLIDCYLQRGFVAEARAELVQRADLEERSGLIKDAIASLQRAADLSWTIGLADETFALYDRVIALAPDDADHRHGLVTLYLQMGRINEAAAHQRAVVDISLRQERTHEAIAALHQVIGLTPDDISAYYQLGELLASIGEYLQAEKVYRRVVSMNPSDAIAQAKLAAMASLRDQQS
jgi:tetratricopeptide (TPR) repeat protein